jgi:hypothetical protein
MLKVKDLIELLQKLDQDRIIAVADEELFGDFDFEIKLMEDCEVNEYFANPKNLTDEPSQSVYFILGPQDGDK